MGAQIRTLPLNGQVAIGPGRRRLVVRDSAAWAKICPLCQTGQRSPVDFTTELIVLVSTRLFSGSGPYVEIDSVRLSGRELTAYVRTGSCDSAAWGEHIMTRPMHAIAVPRRYTKVRFVESYEVEAGCFGDQPDTTA